MKNLLCVGVGGFFGAICRYLIGQLVPPLSDGFPLATLIINLAGCLFLAWFFTVTLRAWRISPQLRLAIGTGFTGAFTTFSTFSVETLHLWSEGYYLVSLLYIWFSIAGGLLLAGAGILIGNRMAPAVREGEAS
ncbi:fluoride efflux transporter CrcB [Paenibacillus sediminis]|uniref:Fluoride-specific ion channel FluC n=1 Tax=Paenibacillus sediminis TaxID=664909 RepID=A0ABS4GY30_9BACL|nr:fluoride efflux transporter CrcB [Paenibacillus sediminis]MBP1935174.1 CrcB protein [Paenibacillus sediminis]